jgi:hypothetical protein
MTLCENVIYFCFFLCVWGGGGGSSGLVTLYILHTLIMQHSIGGRVRPSIDFMHHDIIVYTVYCT